MSDPVEKEAQLERQTLESRRARVENRETSGIDLSVFPPLSTFMQSYRPDSLMEWKHRKKTRSRKDHRRA